MSPDARSLLAATELDPAGARALRDRIEAWTADGSHAPPSPRRYPGYPRRLLPPVHPRPSPGLEEVLRARRCHRPLAGGTPDPEALARLLSFSHGVWAEPARGPTPSAGGLQALELFLVVLEPGWLEPGAHHFDRAGSFLSRVRPDARRDEWEGLVPGLRELGTPPLLLVVVGEVARMEAKYGARAARFLVLEAGHLMQNLCLVAAGMELCVVPMGGFVEGPIARTLDLPRTDAVLYLGALGSPR